MVLPGILLLKHPLPNEQTIEEEIMRILHDRGFRVLEKTVVPDLLAIMPAIYCDNQGNPAPYLARDIESRTRLYGGQQRAIAYLLRHEKNQTNERLDALVGPSAFEVYEQPAFAHTLRARFLGPKVVEMLDNSPKTVRIDAFHCTRTDEEFRKEALLYFDAEILRSYGAEDAATIAQGTYADAKREEPHAPYPRED